MIRRWLYSVISCAIAPTLFAIEAKQSIAQEDMGAMKKAVEHQSSMLQAIGNQIGYGTSVVLRIEREEASFHQSRAGIIDSQLTRILGEFKELNARLKILELELADKRRLSRAKLPDFEQAEALALAGIEVTE